MTAAGEARDGFRPEIDGLRALAVGSVLLFHFDLLGATGGFAGVDVFFVISGYLVTGMLARAQPGSTGLLAFYRRRFWRIAPAYYATIAATVALGAWWLLPSDAERLGMSSLAALVFGSNVFFASGVGYFDTAAIYKPLLHTWSLAVEMQFYLVWPFIVMGLLRLPRAWRTPMLVGIVVASFVACQLLAILDAKVAFFSLPARLWEFGIGGLVAFAGKQGRGRLEHVAPLVLGVALAVLVASPWVIADGDLWPAPWALPVCAATGAIIWLGGARDAVTRLLACAPMTALGRLSYSLYLVHWPVVVFIGYARFPQAPVWMRAVAMLACLPLAYGLYRFVETPLRRHGRAGSLPRARLATLALVPLLVAGLGSTLHLAPLVASAYPASLAQLAPPFGTVDCTPWRGAICRMGGAEIPPTTLLWGDSHALHLVPGVLQTQAARRGEVLLAAKDSCPPVAGLSKVANRFTRRDDCLRHNASVLSAVLSTPQIATVILAARWAFYAETTRFGAEKGAPAFLVSNTSRDLSPVASRKVLEDSLLAQVGQLRDAGKRVVIVGQTPEMGFDALRCVVMSGLAGRVATHCDIPLSAVTGRQAFVDAMFARLKAAGALVVDPRDVLCDEATCHATLDGVAAYRDDNHLGVAGSVAVVARLLGDVLHEPTRHINQGDTP